MLSNIHVQRVTYLNIRLGFSHEQGDDKLAVGVYIAAPCLEKVMHCDKLGISLLVMVRGKDSVGGEAPSHIVRKVVSIHQGHVNLMQLHGEPM